MSLGENAGSSSSSNHLTVDNGPILMAVTKKGRVRGDSHTRQFARSFLSDE